MVREIVKDLEFLSKPCERVTDVKQCKQLIQDMKDTCKHHLDKCAGLCANQIGESKSIIAVRKDDDFFIMVNPKIMSHSSKTYVSKEGCLSLDYESEVTRYHLINVLYTQENGMPAVKEFRGNIARIIQHEVDHTRGKLI